MKCEYSGVQMSLCDVKCLSLYSITC